MKLDILQENLKNAVAVVSRVLVTKPQIPILANILLETKDGQLVLTASNLETTVTLSVGAKIETPGAFTVPGRTFGEVTAGLAAEKITLATEENNLLITGGKFKAKIAGLPAADFPKLTEINEKAVATAWEFSKPDFLKIINQVTFAAATDDSRAALTGILFQPRPDGLVLAAADGFRLSMVTLPKIKNENLDSFLVPAKALLEITRMIGEKITLTLVSHQVIFTTGEIKIYCRCLAGKFPEFEKIIPTNSSLKIVVATEELDKAVKLAAIFARDSANIVKLKMQKSKLKISANAPQTGENETEMEIETEKDNEEEFSIAFNYRYLLDFLNSTDSQEFTAEFNDSLSSGVFRLPSDPNFLHLIMPVRVQN
ncbi:DNA polymerase III subunit beta [Candidatus Gottesmanbacteria bacterium]|nr:DNA polymerase III subunit beta [Candidatus Gottesmanbacteria bacterium]